MLGADLVNTLIGLLPLVALGRGLLPAAAVFARSSGRRWSWMGIGRGYLFGGAEPCWPDQPVPRDRILVPCQYRCDPHANSTTRKWRQSRWSSLRLGRGSPVFYAGGECGSDRCGQYHSSSYRDTQ